MCERLKKEEIKMMKMSVLRWGEAGTKSKHRSAKAKGIREPKEPHAFPVDEELSVSLLAQCRKARVIATRLPISSSEGT